MLRQLSTQFFRIIHDAVFVHVVGCAHHVARATAVSAIVDGGGMRTSCIHNGDGRHLAGFAHRNGGRYAIAAPGPGRARAARFALRTRLALRALRPGGALWPLRASGAGFTLRALWASCAGFPTRPLRPSRTRRAGSTSRPLRPHNIYAGRVGKALIVRPRNHASRAHSGRKRSAIVFATGKILLKLLERFLARFFRGHAALLRRNARGLGSLPRFFLLYGVQNILGFGDGRLQRRFRFQKFRQHHRLDLRVHRQRIPHHRVENIRIPHHGFPVEDLHLRAKNAGFQQRWSLQHAHPRAAVRALQRDFCGRGKVHLEIGELALRDVRQGKRQLAHALIARHAQANFAFRQFAPHKAILNGFHCVTSCP